MRIELKLAYNSFLKRILRERLFYDFRGLVNALVAVEISNLFPAMAKSGYYLFKS